MYEGKQVLRVETKYKSKDLYNIGIEMKDRKGTGNYEDERTNFNVTYIGIKEKNLYQEVKKVLDDRNIEYQNKDKTNMLNGIIFTSGNEFFQSLGMKFKDSGRTYQTGEKKGQKVMIPDIQDESDIPQKVYDYFDYCMDFLKKEVGEENIILAQVHYDEDTPHLQAYFLPIVNKVRRKCFEKDNAGNVIKIKSLTKDGKETYVPKLLRDDVGNIVYENIKGGFLNNDQFWKNKGGKNSFAKLQDSFNEFINSKGFKLDRGKVGAKFEHKTKLEWQIDELENQLDGIKKEIDYSNKDLQSNKNTINQISKDSNNEILNPTKKFTGYNSKDVEKIIDYSKDLEKVKVVDENELNKKDNLIFKLMKENNDFKSNDELVKRNEIIKEQAETIEKQQEEIKYQKTLIDTLKERIEILKRTLEKWKDRLFKVIDKIFGKEVSEYEDDYLEMADKYLDDDYKKDKKQDKDFYI